MFDIGSLEILIILIIALMVIGPARMPEVARKIGQFSGKAKRFMNSMKEDSEISSVIKEVKDSMNIEEEKKQLQEISSSLQDNMQSIHKEWGVDEELNRPSFGNQESDQVADSQFNKAPAQPVIPEKIKPEEEKKTSPATSIDKGSSNKAASSPEPDIKPKQTEKPTPKNNPDNNKNEQ